MAALAAFLALSPADQAEAMALFFQKKARSLKRGAAVPEEAAAVEEVFVPEEVPAVEEVFVPEEVPAVEEGALPEDPGASCGEIGSGSKGREARAGSPVAHRWRELTVFCGAKILDTDFVLRRQHTGAGRERTLAVRVILERHAHAPIAVTEIVREIQEDDGLRAHFEKWQKPSDLEFHVFWVLDRLATIGAVAVRGA